MTAVAFDAQHLSAQAGGDASLMREVLGLFLAHTNKVMRDLEASADAKSWRDCAHALKGSAKGVGCWRVAELAQAAELAPLDAGVLGPLRQALADAQAAIRQHQDASK